MLERIRHEPSVRRHEAQKPGKNDVGLPATGGSLTGREMPSTFEAVRTEALFASALQSSGSACRDQNSSTSRPCPLPSSRIAPHTRGNPSTGRQLHEAHTRRSQRATPLDRRRDDAACPVDPR
jgi:hypothetical protein